MKLDRPLQKSSHRYYACMYILYIFIETKGGQEYNITTSDAISGC